MTSSRQAGARGGARVAAAFLALAILPLSACLPSDSSTSPTPDESPSPTPSADVTPSPSVSVGPSPTGPEPSGPITGAPSGTPITPEIFLATINEEEGLLQVIVVVPGIFEDGGQCAVSVKGTAATILEYSVSAADVSNTACGQFSFSLNQLGSGTATITARYDSAKYSGASEAMQVQLP